MPSNTTPKTICIRGVNPSSLEAKAGAAGILPGHLLQRNSAGNFVVHSTAAGMAERIIAREEEYVGGAIDVAYANGDRVPAWIARPGEQFYMLLATANNIVIGDYLESNGDGTLRKSTHATTNATAAAAVQLFSALEALNNVSGVAQRLKVEAI